MIAAASVDRRLASVPRATGRMVARRALLPLTVAACMLLGGAAALAQTASPQSDWLTDPQPPQPANAPTTVRPAAQPAMAPAAEPAGAAAESDGRMLQGMEVSAEQSRISAGRAAAEAQFQRDAVECYQRFAVNSCLRDARSRRYAVTGDLRRQEIVINDAERRRKGAEALRALEDKAAERAAEQETRVAEGVENAAARDARTAERAASRAARQSEEAANRAASERRQQDQLDRAAARAAAAAGDAERRAQYEERVRRAEARQDEIQRRQEERDKPRAAPLPAPSN